MELLLLGAVFVLVISLARKDPAPATTPAAAGSTPFGAALPTVEPKDVPPWWSNDPSLGTDPFVNGSENAESVMPDFTAPKWAATTSRKLSPFIAPGMPVTAVLHMPGTASPEANNVVGAASLTVLSLSGAEGMARILVLLASAANPIVTDTRLKLPVAWLAGKPVPKVGDLVRFYIES